MAAPEADRQQMQLKIIVTGLKTPVVETDHASHCIELIRQVKLHHNVSGSLLICMSNRL